MRFFGADDAHRLIGAAAKEGVTLDEMVSSLARTGSIRPAALDGRTKAPINAR